MLDRHYTTDELAIAIKKALRPSNIEDMTKEQFEDYIRELENKEFDKKMRRLSILTLIAMVLIPVLLSYYFFPG
ncbi:hypothetical protein [Pelistega suis]|uniref:hypothetical protein n=1 Tax=Pelistega suis TaxID=1631957 RepID=UPI00211C7A79|nr:hypothetical protein [Pelistega suis]MCQ9328324.1 hypothetical protein [Pelistega suis]